MSIRRPPPAPRLLVALLVVWAAAGKAAPTSPTPSRDLPKPVAAPAVEPSTPGPLVLDENPNPLVPRQVPSPEDRDRLEALAMFSAARTLEKQGQDAQALRLYQRALRYDPRAAAIARQIVLLAYRLGRHAEAVRYAMELVELDKPDPLLLNQLAAYLTEQGEWDRASRLYEDALGSGKGEERSVPTVLLRMQMGRLYHLVEKHDQAADCFAAVLDALKASESAGIDEEVKKVLLGDASATYGLIGETFLQAGRPAEAATAFESAHQAEPNKGVFSYRLARVALHQGELQTALARLQVYFDERLSIEAMEPYRLLAEILAALGRPQDLIPWLESLYRQDRTNVPLAYALAEKYLEAETFDKAEALYVDLIARAPTTVGFRNLADLYRKTGKMESLLKVLGEAVAATSSLEPLETEGHRIAEDGPLVEKLVETAQAQYRSQPKQFPFSRRLAVALLALNGKRYEPAKEFFDLAIEAKPEQAADLSLTWGLGLLVDEQYARAAEVFRRGLAREVAGEEKAELHFYLAAALEMDGRTEEAVAAARRAAKLRPNDPRFLGRVAWILYHGKRNAEAAAAYRELIDKFDADHDSTEVRDVLREARFVLSNIAATEQQFSQAEEWLEQILDEFPGDAGALNDLGYLWADQNKNLLRAHRMIRAAVDKDPENAAYRDSLGWVLYRLGRFQEAVPELEKALSLAPDPVVLDHLGDACHSLQQFDKARQSWRKAADELQEKGEKEKAGLIEQKIRQLQL